MNPTPTSRLALVTGATGHVGGELVQRLLAQHWRVRVITRSADKLDDLPWADQVDVVEGDASDSDAMHQAMADVDVAWYLLHSMGESGNFVETEHEMADIFADAAAVAGVSRIVYLGGLHPEGVELSDHLASRVAVGQRLLDSPVPTAALQAGVVIGQGSASFDMLRHLSERLPGAIGPDWLNNQIQPIAVDDLMHYLVAAADLPAEINRTFDIGGPDVLSYGEMMSRYARAVGLGPRLVLTAPVTTPRAAARWIGLVTPVSSSLATPLVESLLHDTVVAERDLDDLIGAPPGGHTSFDEAVKHAADGLDTRRWLRTLALTGAAVAVTATIGSLATNPQTRWYRSLRKPSWQPAPWLFPVVWTALFADIAAVSALSLADLDETDQHDQRRAHQIALATNLVLNLGWSLIFFRGRNLPLASVESVLLAASSIDLVRRSAKVSPEKGVVLAPYAAWTTFAAVLSGTLTALNRRPRRRK